jgi:hypothetical protein
MTHLEVNEGFEDALPRKGAVQKLCELLHNGYLRVNVRHGVGSCWDFASASHSSSQVLMIGENCRAEACILQLVPAACEPRCNLQHELELEAVEPIYSPLLDIWQLQMGGLVRT